MIAHKILIHFALPFLFVVIGMFVNEYRLLKNNKISYETFTNSIALMLTSLIAFIIVQGLLWLT